MKQSAEMSKSSVKHKARVGQVGVVIWTIKHKCKAVKRMEGVLRIAWVRKTQGADEAGKQISLGWVKSKRIGVGHKGPCQLQD